MNKKRILIVEDEFLIAEDLKCQLEELDYVVIGVFNKYEEVIRAVQSYKPDLIFLDINLSSEKTGIEIAREIDEKFAIPFIFMTAHADKETIDKAKVTRPKGYLVKPFNTVTLRSSLEIIFYAIDVQKEEPVGDNQCLVAKDGATVFKLPYKKIKWIKSDKQYMEIHGEDEKKRVVRMTMEELETHLPKQLFCRVHRSYIVNIDYIKEMRAQFLLVDNIEIPVGRKFKEDVQSILKL